MATYWVEVIVEERDDCEPFASTEQVARFVEGKLREGVVVEADVMTVRIRKEWK